MSETIDDEGIWSVASHRTDEKPPSTGGDSSAPWVTAGYCRQSMDCHTVWGCLLPSQLSIPIAHMMMMRGERRQGHQT
jgi:hypothetical protein